MWKYGVTAPLPVELAKSFVQDSSNSTVSMKIAIETMELQQFCTEMGGLLMFSIIIPYTPKTKAHN